MATDRVAIVQCACVVASDRAPVTIAATVKIESGRFIIKTVMASQYDSYEGEAILLGALSGIGSGVMHIYMRNSGYSNLSIIDCAARCVTYVAAGAMCYNSYRYVTICIPHGSTYNGLVAPFMTDAFNALTFKTIYYYIGWYACVLLIEALPSAKPHIRIYRAARSFVQELFGN